MNDCLQKDPSKRPSIEQIFKTHKKFFAKARNAQFLKENFIGSLREVFLRDDNGLQMEG